MYLISISTTKLPAKSFAQQKTTYEFHFVSRCKSMLIENFSFAVSLKSFANLFFKQFPEVNRQISVVFRKTELVSDVSTLIIVSRLARV